MTNEELAEAVKRIFEADAKRTQGEWRTSPYSDSRVFWEGSREALASCNDGILFTEYPAEDNAAFIATAPLMVRTIRQLWAEREDMEKEMLEQCRIIGAGGERELALMTKIEEQRREIEKVVAEREQQRAAMVKAKEAILCMRIGKFFITPRSGEDAIAALESVGV